jgi:Holliday junction resolvase
MRLLEASGYTCTRASASIGIFDVIAIGSRDVVLVQVKSNRWPLEVEMEGLREFKAPPNCRKLIHRWKDRRQLPDVREVR